MKNGKTAGEQPASTMHAENNSVSRIFKTSGIVNNDGILHVFDFKNGKAWRKARKKFSRTKVVVDHKGRHHAMFMIKQETTTADALEIIQVIGNPDGIDDAVDLDEAILNTHEELNEYLRRPINDEFWPAEIPKDSMIRVTRGNDETTIRALYRRCNA